MPEPIKIPLTVDAVVKMRHARCTFTADDVRRDAKDNWPDNVDMLWVLEHGAAQVKDRVWLAFEGLRQLPDQRGQNALCRALRRILKRLLDRPNIAPVKAVGEKLLGMLDHVIASATLTNGPAQSQWDSIEGTCWQLARAPQSRSEVRLAASAIARMSELGRGSEFAVLSATIQMPALLAGASVPLEAASQAEQQEYLEQMRDVAAAYRGEI